MTGKPLPAEAWIMLDKLLNEGLNDQQAAIVARHQLGEVNERWLDQLFVLAHEMYQQRAGTRCADHFEPSLADAAEG